MTEAELRAAILRFLDGEATPDEERALVRRIRGDGAAERLLAEMVRFHGNFAALLKERSSAVRPRRQVGRAVAVVACAAVAFWIASRTWTASSRVAARARPFAARDTQPATVTAVRAADQAIAPIVQMPIASADGALLAPALADVFVRFDFEDGRKPAGWIAAPVVHGPPRPGNRFCLQGYRYAKDSPESNGVYMEDRRSGLFEIHDNAALSFDYWLGEWTGRGPTGIFIWIWNETAKTSNFAVVRNVAPTHWMHAVVPFTAFQVEARPRADLSRRLRPGDRVGFLLIRTDWHEQDVIFVDNVEIGRLAGPSGEARP